MFCAFFAVYLILSIFVINKKGIEHIEKNRKQSFSLNDFCKRRKIDREWLASKQGTLEIDADKSRLPEDELIVGRNLTIKCKTHCTLPPLLFVWVVT